MNEVQYDGNKRADFVKNSELELFQPSKKMVPKVKEIVELPAKHMVAWATE